MRDREQQPVFEPADPTRPAMERHAGLREQSEPLKREGDALRDGSGSRQGQTPPVADPGQPD